MTDDNRNVADRYKGWMEDLIKKDLTDNSFPFATMMENWQGDFNIGTMIRNANAFGAKEVFYIGKRKWDKRGAVGTYNYTNLTYLENIEALEAKKSEYTLIGIDNVPGSVPIDSFKWPKNSLMIFGEEAIGLTEEVQKVCTAIVEIPMYGSVRSLNAGSSSAIIMYDYITKLQKDCICDWGITDDAEKCLICKKEFHY